MGYGVLVFDQEEPCALVGPEQQLPHSVFVGTEAQSKNARRVPAQQRLHVAVESLRTIVGQHDQSRHAGTAFHAGLLIGVFEPQLVCGKRPFGAFEASNDSSGNEGAPQGLFHILADFNPNGGQIAAFPKRMGSQREFAPKMSGDGIVVQFSR